MRICSLYNALTRCLIGVLYRCLGVSRCALVFLGESNSTHHRNICLADHEQTSNNTVDFRGLHPHGERLIYAFREFMQFTKNTWVQFYRGPSNYMHFMDIHLAGVEY